MESIIKSPDNQEHIKKMREHPELYERTGEYWTDEEREKLRRLYLDGTGISEISLELQRPESAIMMQLSGSGLIQRAQRRRDSQRNKCLCSICDLAARHSGCPRCREGGQADAGTI